MPKMLSVHINLFKPTKKQAISMWVVSVDNGIKDGMIVELNRSDGTLKYLVRNSVCLRR